MSNRSRTGRKKPITNDLILNHLRSASPRDASAYESAISAQRRNTYSTRLNERFARENGRQQAKRGKT